MSVPEYAMNPLAQRLLKMVDGLNFKDFVAFLSAFSAKASIEQKAAHKQECYLIILIVQLLEYYLSLCKWNKVRSTLWVYDLDDNGKVTFNDIIEVLSDMTGSFMTAEQREVPGCAVPYLVGLPAWLAGPCLSGVPVWLGCLPGWQVPAWEGCLLGWAGAYLALLGQPACYACFMFGAIMEARQQPGRQPNQPDTCRARQPSQAGTCPARQALAQPGKPGRDLPEPACLSCCTHNEAGSKFGF
uniref:EF-hand domain-containing protein n=1 Tax=Chenopodium quinoa TaxID=63459 RepID=A0A803M857_CHEQI